MQTKSGKNFTSECLKCKLAHIDKNKTTCRCEIAAYSVNNNYNKEEGIIIDNEETNGTCDYFVEN